MELPSISLAQIALYGTVLAVTTVFLACIDLAGEGWANPFDRKISRFMVRHRNAEETGLMRLLSFLGGPYGLALMGALYVVIAVLTNNVALAVYFLGCVVGGTIYVLGLKIITARKRPILKALEIERTYSFPSAHSLVSAIVYLAIGATFHAAIGGALGDTLLGLVLAFLLAIGVSRVYLGVHYPSDVLAGLLGGTVWAWILVSLSSLH